MSEAEMRGQLASGEDRPAVPYSAEERQEDFTYFHLCCARDARMEMERLDEGSHQYMEKRIDRLSALERARFHLAERRALGLPISGEIAQLALSEGA